MREKFIFCDLALLASFRRLLLEDIKFFDYFQNSVIVKIRGVYFRYFAGYHLEGRFISRAKFSEKDSNESGRMKTMCEFSRKGLFFSHSRCLPIEGIFYRRTNLAFSIRYISEKILRLNLRHGRVRQSMGSVDR